MKKTERCWRVDLQVVRPQRPGMRTQVQVPVRAIEREDACRLAAERAVKDGMDVRCVVGATRGPA